MSSRIIRYTLTAATAAAVTTLTIAVWLAVVMLRTPWDCGWCRDEHP